MNLQINTSEKTIKLAETVNLNELAEVLNKLLPNNEWKEYKLETNTIINNWSNPTIIYRDRYWPSYPWNTPIYISGSTGGICVSNTATFNSSSSQGTYNLSIN